MENVARKLAVARESDRLQAAGATCVTMRNLRAAFAALGYRVARRGTRSIARCVAGIGKGDWYPTISFHLFDQKTGLSAYHHYTTERDARHVSMQKLRGDLFAVTRDGIACV